MRIAIPVTDDGRIAGHFGHCAAFVFFEGNPDSGEVQEVGRSPSPEHRPGVLPRLLIGQNVDVLLCGGIGARARDILEAAGVSVVSGVQTANPAGAALEYIQGRLRAKGGQCTGHGRQGSGCSH